MAIWVSRLGLTVLVAFTAAFLIAYAVALVPATRDAVTARLSGADVAAPDAAPQSASAPVPASDAVPASESGVGADAAIAQTLGALRTAALQHRLATSVDIDYGREAASRKASGQFDEARALIAKRDADIRLRDQAQAASGKAIVTLEQQMFADPAAADRALRRAIAGESDPKVRALLERILAAKDEPGSQPGRYGSRFGGAVVGAWYSAGSS